jgi:hypothetical protein
MSDKNLSRIRRQFDALGRAVPPARRIIDPLMRNGMRWLRLPVSFILIAGGLLAFLPILGLWMLPLGLLLLAVDIPLLRPGVGAGMIWTRRRVGRLARRSRRAEANR